MTNKSFLITGGAGFIGSAVIRYLINHTDHKILCVDKLTYAGNLDSLSSVSTSDRYSFKEADICNQRSLLQIFTDFKPDIVMHLAAETHVDRSIDNPSDFIQTNIIGTYYLLETVRTYWNSLSLNTKSEFRFHHVSTDEVYGDLSDAHQSSTELTRYNPSSPYSASKASSDHLVRAWHRTYEIPILITNCSNNYGPYHYPEKLIPHTILNAIEGKLLPVYGGGSQIRDWLYVEDHAEALVLVATAGTIGDTYNIGGHNERKNLDVIKTICDLLEELNPNKPVEITNYRELITFVRDRPGHDLRYSLNANKIADELGWTPSETFESGLRKTVAWYLSNKNWWKRILDGEYKLNRLGDIP